MRRSIRRAVPRGGWRGGRADHKVAFSAGLASGTSRSDAGAQALPSAPAAISRQEARCARFQMARWMPTEAVALMRRGSSERLRERHWPEPAGQVPCPQKLYGIRIFLSIA